MGNNQLAIINWELATQLAGNKRELAEEILALLIKDLPSNLHTFKQLNSEQNYSELLRQVHKLHGAVCYTGLERLKVIIARLETEIKNNIMINSSSLLEQLDTEVKLLLEITSHLTSEPSSAENGTD